MDKKRSPTLRLVGIILGLIMMVSLIVLVFGILSQWSTSEQYSNGFFIAGAIAIGLGLFSVAGRLEQQVNSSTIYAESAGQASLAERTQRMMADINQSYGFMMVLVSVGILLIGISIVIGQFS